MLEFYPQIKWVHIACVLASGGLFALRGALVQLGHAGVAHWAGLRWLSYAIDTTLLTAALMLLSMLPGALFANGWLLTKLALLCIYIGLGAFALSRARTAGGRLACFVGALAVYGTVVGIARMHHPLGWLHGWLA